MKLRTRFLSVARGAATIWTRMELVDQSADVRIDLGSILGDDECAIQAADTVRRLARIVGIIEPTLTVEQEFVRMPACGQMHR